MNHNNCIEFLPREDLITSEDAKRLVACWNACIGIDTDQLEPKMLGNQIAAKMKVIDERHALRVWAYSAAELLRELLRTSASSDQAGVIDELLKARPTFVGGT